MQFVATAQIIFVLWLLAATAPAATALVNGSLTVLIDARTKDLQLSPASGESPGEALDGEDSGAIDFAGPANLSTLFFFNVSGEEHLFSVIVSEGFEIQVTEAPPFARSLSLLHTGLQRHRPRLV
ncbi:MAG TPA: hypothetical protein VFG14_20600 [Chthoniobacteraceae bacterium]|nr:hypothetical protein [Chthoniobacteraceae bacterium]